MARVVVLGGTGYTGSLVAAEAAGRGHDVTWFSRGLPERAVPGVTYETGSMADDADRERGADFAAAIVDEIDRPAHRREQFSVAY